CWTPKAFRIRKRTIDIFRNPVIVTTASGTRPIVETTKMMLMRLGSKLVIRQEPLDAYTNAVANLHQTAVADLSAIGHNVDGALARLCQGVHIARCKTTHRGEGHIEAADLEDEADRQLIERCLLNGSARQSIGWILHEPLSCRVDV